MLVMSHLFSSRIVSSVVCPVPTTRNLPIKPGSADASAPATPFAQSGSDDAGNVSHIHDYFDAAFAGASTVCIATQERT